MLQNNNICILLATHNGGKYLSAQLDSLLSQVGVYVDIFISDDNSTDDTLEIINSYTSKFRNIKLLNYKNKFGSAARNFYRLFQDVSFDGYDYIALSDQDDIWYPEKLKIASTFLKSSNYDAYSSNVIAFWPDGTFKKITKSGMQRRYDFLFEPAGPGCTYVLPLSSAQLIKNYLNNYPICLSFLKHDWLFYAILRSCGLRWHIDSSPYMLYRQHGYNEVGANIGLKAKFKRLQILLSGEYLNNCFKLAGMLNIDQYIFFSSNPFSIRYKFFKNYSHTRRNGYERLFLFIMVLVGFAKF